MLKKNRNIIAKALFFCIVAKSFNNYSSNFN
jgi:hypothetical protein